MRRLHGFSNVLYAAEVTAQHTSMIGELSKRVGPAVPVACPLIHYQAAEYQLVCNAGTL
jgi:hypothetical protein